MNKTDKSIKQAVINKKVSFLEYIIKYKNTYYTCQIKTLINNNIKKKKKKNDNKTRNI
jgi:hypothetical protein